MCPECINEIKDRLSIKDVIVLSQMLEYDNQFAGVTKKQISEMEDIKDTDLKGTTLNHIITRLVLVGFLKEGANSGKGTNYYITEDGKYLLQMLMPELFQ